MSQPPVDTPAVATVATAAATVTPPPCIATPPIPVAPGVAGAGTAATTATTPATTAGKSSAGEGGAGAGVSAGPSAAASGGDGGGGGAVAVIAKVSTVEADLARRRALLSWLPAWPAILAQLNTLTTSLKRREPIPPRLVAKSTATLLRNMVGTCRVDTVEQMMTHIRAVGKHLHAASPLQLSAENVVRRTLFFIRSHGVALARDRDDGGYSAAADTEVRVDLSAPFSDFKAVIIDSLNKLIGGLEDLVSPIVKQALDHIHASEVILTYGHDVLVEEFLKAAAKRRKFEVYVAESAPTYGGHSMARALATAEHPVTVTVISDAAVFALMARVHKVIIGTHAIMANGGLLVQSGGHPIALSAQAHAVPVVCVAGMFQLCPLYPHDYESFNEMVSPADVMSYAEADSLGGVDVVNPAYDYIPPDNVDLFVTDVAGLPPSYVYRVLSDRYHADDYKL